MKLFNLFKKKNKQTCFYYCPKCGNELASSNSKIETKDNIYYDIKCNKCENKSKWFFDAPVPILIKNYDK